MFRRSISPPFSRSKSELTKKLCGLLFDPEDRGDTERDESGISVILVKLSTVLICHD
jgi:hypothetical protein